LLGVCDRRAQGPEFVARQCALDQREQDVLLVADVRLQALSQLVQRRRRRGVVLRQFLRATAQVDVLDQHAHDRLVVRGTAARERGQQHLLLDTEMVRAFGVPEREEHLAGSRRVGLRGSPQRQCGEQPVVVVAGERREFITALHGGCCTA